MFVKFLREHVIASYLLLILRIYVGWEWVQAGWEKITGDTAFDSAKFLQAAVKKATGEHPAVQNWWASFLSHVAVPNAGFFSFLVQWGELLVGIGLIVGCFTTFATLMGMIMNFAYLLSGTTSTNPQLLLLEIFIVVAGFNAAKWGLDYWVIPYLKSWTAGGKHWSSLKR